MKNLPILLLVSLTLFSCQDKTSEQEVTLYFGGPIITMSGENLEYTECLVEGDGDILFVGELEKAKAKYTNMKYVDLKNQTLIPGLIEPHLHPSLAAIMLQNEVIAPYDWQLPNGLKKGVQGEKAYRERLAKSIERNAKLDTLYLVWGYHQLWHGELSRGLLNTISSEYPIGVIHRSFHEVFLNDAAIRLLELKEADFKGNPQVDWEKGHFFEGGWLALTPKIAPILLQPESYLKGLSSMSLLLEQNGITTIAEPGFPSADFDLELNLLMQEMENKPAYEVYLIPSGTQLYTMKGSNAAAMGFMEGLGSIDKNQVHFLPKQVKLFADGAIYSQLMQMKSGYTDGHEGAWMTPLDLFSEQLNLYWDKGYKIHVHANGDQGQQMVIDLVEKAQIRNPRKNHQLTLHHMGYFTENMANQMADLGMEASVNPYYLWALADKYGEYGLGTERAANLVALKYLIDANIPTSFHSDFSMAPVEPLTLVWTAVNRVSSEGTPFSQDQKISVYDAMKAVTIDAARTLSLEKSIGSLEPGKKANFTILEDNPFTIHPIQIRDIKVNGVVFKGQIHRKPMLAGGWSKAEVSEEVIEVTNFVVNQNDFNSPLNIIISVKKQVVSGMNYDILFELKNGQIYRTVVYRDLQEQISVIEEPQLVKK